MRVDVVSRALAVVFVGTLSASASAGFQLISQSHLVDLARRETTFMLEFSDPPDFRRTVAGPHEPFIETDAHAFQVFYGSSFAGEDVLGHDVVVLRGPEIRHDGDLRVRDTLGMDEDPRAGGFGRLRGSVPFDLDDQTVMFTVPWELLGETDQAYRFVIESYDSGELTSSISVAAPLPAAVWPALALLAGALTSSAARKRLRRRV